MSACSLGWIRTRRQSEVGWSRIHLVRMVCLLTPILLLLGAPSDAGAQCPTLGCEIARDGLEPVVHWFDHSFPAPHVHCWGPALHPTCHAAKIDGDCETHPSCIVNLYEAMSAAEELDISALRSIVLSSTNVFLDMRGVVVLSSCSADRVVAAIPLPSAVADQVPAMVSAADRGSVASAEVTVQDVGSRASPESHKGSVRDFLVQSASSVLPHKRSRPLQFSGFMRQ